eukprot:TRINITY_DN12845_c0_g1_i2.p1 TRINITY_DN12845_c0_g1~~TRINITY_DN12845_c0_g1_i2.p1  ORF type:complete len:775 (-),score=137.19 TRINITY_DN12845_c0_g1_i2:147-2471(-)
MTSSSDDAPTTLWALLGRGEKKVAVFLDGEHSEAGSDVYITLKDGSRFDMQEQDVLWMYTATTCFCCGCREREILCPSGGILEGMDDYFDRYPMLKSIEAGQDVRKMSRLELRYRDGVVLSVGMTCNNMQHTLYFRGVAEAVQQKLGLISCRKTSGPGHRTTKTSVAEVVAEAEPYAEAEADRHMRELLASEGPSETSAGQRTRKKAKSTRSIFREVPAVPDQPSQLTFTSTATCSAKTADEQDSEQKSENILQIEGPAPREMTTSETCSLMAESVAQAEADRHTQELLGSACQHDEPVRRHRSNRAKTACKLPQDSVAPVPDQPPQRGLAHTTTRSAKTAESRDSETKSKSNSQSKVPPLGTVPTMEATSSDSPFCTLAAELGAQAEADRHMQELLASESERNKPVRQRHRKKTEVARPRMQEVPEDSDVQDSEEESKSNAPSESRSPRAITTAATTEADSSNSDSFTLVKGRKTAKGPRADATPGLLHNWQQSSLIPNRGHFTQSDAFPALVPSSKGRPVQTESYRNVVKDLAVDLKSARARTGSSSCTGQCGQSEMPEASCPIAVSSEPKMTAPCPTSQPPPVPETRDVDEGIFQQELKRVKAALDESLARQNQDLNAERGLVGLGLCWEMKQMPNVHGHDHIQRELDLVKASLDEALAREDHLLQLVVSLRRELSIAKGSLTIQSVDSLEEVGGFESTCLQPPPGLELQSVSTHEPMKVHISSFNCSTRKSTDDASVTSTACCADEDCGWCELENWQPANLAGFCAVSQQ